MITLVMLQKPLDPGPDPPSSRTAQISSARRSYSVIKLIQWIPFTKKKVKWIHWMSLIKDSVSSDLLVEMNWRAEKRKRWKLQSHGKKIGLQKSETALVAKSKNGLHYNSPNNKQNPPKAQTIDLINDVDEMMHSHWWNFLSDVDAVRGLHLLLLV